MSDFIEATPSQDRNWGKFVVRILLILVVATSLVLLGRSLGRPEAGAQADLEPTLAALSTELALAQQREQPTRQPSAAPTGIVEEGEALAQPATGEVVVFTDFQDGYRHLYLTEPGSLSFVPLTSGAHNNADPALSHDGTKVAFRSNRHGNWELYLLELASGQLQRLTNTLDYEGHPTWSPDDRWIAYEGYRDGDLDVWILPLEEDEKPIQLTNHPGLDASPTWDPAGGRQIAFISDRDGSKDLFLANLDMAEDRFLNLSQTPLWDELDPAFDPAGEKLAYATNAEGLNLVWTLDLTASDPVPTQIGPGTRPQWSGGATSLAVVQMSPHYERTAVFDLVGNSPALGLNERGPELQLSWGLIGVDQVVTADGQAPQPLALLPTQQALSGMGRQSLIVLDSVDSIDARLVEAAQAPFEQLRAAIAARAGWDFLDNLEAAYVGLNDPLPPGFAYNDWLYTGRAFAFESAALESDWVEVIPEQFGGQLYWRVFVRAATQDGSLGRPLQQRPWDFSTRYSGNPSDYDSGGQPASTIPAGYYVDFTALAEAYGFDRQPALNNWRSFYHGARFNAFAYTEGLDWQTAMLQLYPPEAIATPTAFSSPTPTPTRTPWPTATPWWWRWRTPTPTPWPTPITPTPTNIQ